MELRPSTFTENLNAINVYTRKVFEVFYDQLPI